MRHAFASGMIARGISSTALAALMGTSRARELADGLSVTLPVEFARTQLRPLLNQTDLQRVREDLQTLVGFAKQEKWPKEHVRFFKEFLRHFGVSEEEEA